MPVCPACGEDNPERARFCLACASPLPAGPAAGRKERKFAAALFADLVGSTSLAEREDPEVVQAVVNRAFDRLSDEVERFDLQRTTFGCFARRSGSSCSLSI